MKKTRSFNRISKLNSKKKRKKILSILILVIFIIISFATFAVFYPRIWVPAEYNVTLEQPLYSVTNIPIGAAIDIEELQTNAKYNLIASEQFNSITAENVMKMESLLPDPTNYSWSDADYLVEFAQNNSQIVHGHCLVWHKQLPLWIYDYNGTQDQWRLLLKSYVQTVIGHFEGKITSWDVVNEAFEGTEFRETIWYTKIGPNYIKDAFIWAHEADPNVKLYYNDFDLCSNREKLDFVLQYLEECLEEGIPIDGIGLQAHIEGNWPDRSDIQYAIRQINTIDLEVRISELDIALNHIEFYQVYSEYLAEKQAHRYYDFVQIISQAARLTSITLWGIYDGGSWIRSFNNPDWPLLFDEKLNPKPAALYFQQALLNFI